MLFIYFFQCAYNISDFNFVLNIFRIRKLGNSLAVRWLGLHAFTAVARVQSLVGEIRSHKPQGTAKKKEKKRKTLNVQMAPFSLIAVIEVCTKCHGKQKGKGEGILKAYSLSM